MDLFGVLNMLGGMALFMFGMRQLTEGLERRSGGRLGATLETLTSAKWKGVLLGAGVTAVIQSSSAAMAALVGLVNSGLLTLSRATPVVLGANIGTTATAWILSLAGIASDHAWVRLLMPDALSPILAAVGALTILIGGSDRRREAGGILIGFAIVMYGLRAMSDAVKPLADQPGFRNLLLMFTNPVLGVLLGAALAGVVQSSSVSVGMLQALSLTGAVPWSAAVPIVMGQNIGTCVTALLSGVGASVSARRVAVAHLYFNALGAAFFLPLFSLARALAAAPRFDRPITIVEIAAVHSVYNILSMALAYPLLGRLEWLAVKSVPDILS